MYMRDDWKEGENPHQKEDRDQTMNFKGNHTALKKPGKNSWGVEVYRDQQISTEQGKIQ